MSEVTRNIEPRHDVICNFMLYGRECDCGLDALRAKLQAAEAEKDQLRMDRDRLQSQVDICYYKDSVKEIDRLQAEVDNLASLVRILVHSLRKVNPDSSNIIRAMDYLKRNGLTGSILRSDEPQPKEIKDSGGHLESADCWCEPTVEEHDGGTLIIHNQTH